ncbi:MAG: S41 family peptidase, partial [Bacteroidota bacterium]
QQQKSTHESASKQSIAYRLKISDFLPIKARLDLYHRLKAEQADVYDFDNEDSLNMYGYSLLWADKPQEALEIFKLIVSEFPHSANAYDSLAEAYLKLGDSEQALSLYEHSLSLNPDNYNAQDQIEKIKFPDRQAESPAQKFTKRFTVEQYRADLDELGQKLAEIHPNVFKFTSEADFWALVEAKKALLTEQTTYAQFSWHCSEIVAAANCSHTSSGDFFPEWQMLPIRLVFPIETRLIGDQLYIVDPGDHEAKLHPGDEILSINGVAVESLIKKIFSHIPSQGHIETSKTHHFNDWAVGMIPYALDFPEQYKIVVKGKSEAIQLSSLSRYSFPEGTNQNNCPEDLCLEILADKQSAILTIASFNYYPWNNLNEFESFIDRSFQQLREEKIQHLIIDVRGNGGGSPESSIYLLRHLMKKPFPYFVQTVYRGGQGMQQPIEQPFQGTLVFLIDGRGNSTTGHFMALAKEHQLGIIVGEELGSNQFCTADRVIRRLPNTRLEFYVADKTSVVSVNSIPDTRGVMPDHEVQQTISEYLQGKDAVKDFALQLLDDK